jgi:type IV pilus biogenesis protein CpaD/CtpE
MDEVARDLRASREHAAEDIPSLEHTMMAARQARERHPGEGWHVFLFRQMSARPAWAAVAVALVVGLGVLVFPWSYDRLVGHDVTLTLGGSGVTPTSVAALASELKSRLGSDQVRVEGTMDNGALSYELSTWVARKQDRNVPAIANAFAEALTHQGYTAKLQVTPRTERVSSTLSAYAMDRAIEISINISDKTAAEVENEIRSRLIQAGFADAKVSVTDLGDNKREVKIEAHNDSHDAGQPHDQLNLVLTKDGKPITGGFSMRLQKTKDSQGNEQLSVNVQDGDKQATALVSNPKSMTDAALRDEVSRQLRAAGLDVNVNVTNGLVEVSHNGTNVKVENGQVQVTHP